jgi:antitoxin VapB
MWQGTVFTSNRTQNVRFPDDEKNATVRAVGKARTLTPVENAWDRFFRSRR